VFTVDVEDWYHILASPGTPPVERWASMPSRIEYSLPRLLDILDEAGKRATFFFLGWIAQRHPGLVRETRARGHEIAAHGYRHRLVYEMSEHEFSEDAVRTRELLEDISGAGVTGYRAAGFSVTPRTPWFWEALARAGYSYDSSIFPAHRAHGGFPGADLRPHEVTVAHGIIREFPISVTRILGRPVCLFGGGYLRLSPYRWMAGRARRLQSEGQPVIFYLHPREIDPDSPRLRLCPWRRFKAYVNLRGTEVKVRRLLAEFEFVTFAQWLARRPAAGER
jgi:polysaccharide deacetylase family protein (PEP-CTERM system associated)